MRPLAISSAILSLTALACSAESPSVGDTQLELGSSASAIIGGQAYDGHPAVLFLTVDGPGYYGSCTASLIAPDIALTAAHCVEDYAANRESARVSNAQTPNRSNAADWTRVSTPIFSSASCMASQFITVESIPM